MGLDTFELISAALREAPIAAAVESAIRAMPPVTPERPRKAVDFAPVLGVKSGVVFEALASFDNVKAGAFKVSDLIGLLDLEQSGPLGQQVLALEALIADIKD